ncbi:MAG: hypothetical protein DRR19_26215 [Candidatus Parabeggiatoa sp. nov. 1]|nr:MAG: hypothetical protein DRR19_26215 [Gammaproteobacteria bacterium]
MLPLALLISPFQGSLLAFLRPPKGHFISQNVGWAKSFFLPTILGSQAFDVIWLCGNQFLSVYIYNSLIFNMFIQKNLNQRLTKNLNI